MRATAAQGPRGGGRPRPPLLEARHISKSFPGVHALTDVDLTCWAGRVLALVGENGAGKSTLVGVLAGNVRPDQGELLLDGNQVQFSGPRDALQAGVAAVYQEFALLPHLSVVHNVLLGLEPAKLGVIRHGQARGRVKQLLQELGMGTMDLNTTVRNLSVAQQQVVEIAKALAHDARLLIMDEPSAVLAGNEWEHLRDLIKRLAASGVSIVFISHRLNEVEEVADDITILRDGEVVSSCRRDELSRDDVVRRMVGRPLDQAFPARKKGWSETPVLEVRGLRLPGTEPNGLSFTVRSGEILGVAGLVGSGRSRLARALVGLEDYSAGGVYVKGRPLARRTLRAAAEQGLVLLPEDRKALGLVLPLPVAANITLPVLEQVSRMHVLSGKAERTLADGKIHDLGIRTAGPNQLARELSGGNQQKVVLAKWLAAGPSVLVLDEPLRGVDVGAKTEIYAIIRDLADAGAGIILISSELPEILGLTDRILVMREGRVAGELERKEASEEKIMALAVGEQVA